VNRGERKKKEGANLVAEDTFHPIKKNEMSERERMPSPRQLAGREGRKGEILRSPEKNNHVCD